MKRRALYPGTFDPITNGHIDVLEQGLNIFDEILIVVAQNSQKSPIFTAGERVEMIREATVSYPNVSVSCIDNRLLIQYAKEQHATAILRGLRQVADFEYEFQIALMNRHLTPEITTVFLMPHEKYTYLTSSIIREVARLGGEVADFVPYSVLRHLAKKLSTNHTQPH
ncbi:MAG: pantetheine-phosphate adenylyltransferase [Rhizobacter sp.]|nr:pantetheine-phosphate adenylyltransferase [Chlorobiales bacterium]